MFSFLFLYSGKCHYVKAKEIPFSPCDPMTRTRMKVMRLVKAKGKVDCPKEKVILKPCLKDKNNHNKKRE